MWKVMLMVGKMVALQDSRKLEYGLIYATVLFFFFLDLHELAPSLIKRPNDLFLHEL